MSDSGQMRASGIYLVSLVAAHLAGFRMTIGWGLYQLLDPGWLLAAPLQSLIHLHGQPPVLNLLLWAVLRVAETSGLPPEYVAKGVFVLVGWGAVLLVHALVRGFSGSSAWALGAVALLVANPAFHLFGNTFFYPFLVLTLLLVCVWTTWGYVSGVASAYPLVFTLGLVALTRVLYHPVWAVGILGLAITARAWKVAADPFERRAAWREGLLPAACLIGLVLAWPLKNYVVFGEFTNTSWTGFNLTNGLPIEPNADFVAFLRDEPLSRQMRRNIRQQGRRLPEAVRPMLLEPRKSDGSRNYNHLAILLTNDDMRTRATRWRLENPGTWARSFLGQYWSWARPTFAQPYSGGIEGPEGRVYRAYAQVVSGLLFFDLRPLIEPLVPFPGLHEFARVRRNPLPYTGFGVLVFPVVMIASLILLLRGTARRDALAMALLIGWVTVLWSMAVPSATFGAEGNRMRFATVAVFLVLTLYTIHDGVARLRDRRARTPRQA